MKQLTLSLFICLFFIASCGSAKKVTAPSAPPCTKDIVYVPYQSKSDSLKVWNLTNAYNRLNVRYRQDIGKLNEKINSLIKDCVKTDSTIIEKLKPRQLVRIEKGRQRLLKSIFNKQTKEENKTERTEIRQENKTQRAEITTTGNVEEKKAEVQKDCNEMEGKMKTWRTIALWSMGILLAVVVNISIYVYTKIRTV